MLINTVILRGMTVKNVTSLKPLLADMGMIFIFAAFSFLFKTDKGKFRYLLVWSIFGAFLGIVNSIYYSYYSSFVSISLLATSTFVSDVCCCGLCQCDRDGSCACRR